MYKNQKPGEVNVGVENALRDIKEAKFDQGSIMNWAKRRRWMCGCGAFRRVSLDIALQASAECLRKNNRNLRPGSSGKTPLALNIIAQTPKKGRCLRFH